MQRFFYTLGFHVICRETAILDLLTPNVNGKGMNVKYHKYQLNILVAQSGARGSFNILFSSFNAKLQPNRSFPPRFPFPLRSVLRQRLEIFGRYGLRGRVSAQGRWHQLLLLRRHHASGPNVAHYGARLLKL